MENKIVKLYYEVTIGNDTRVFRCGLNYIPYDKKNCNCLLGNYNDFETALKCAPKVLPDFIWVDKTIFREECLFISRNLEYGAMKITAQNFKSMKIYKKYELVPSDFYSLDDLKEELTSKEMLQFLLDKNAKKP